MFKSAVYAAIGLICSQSVLAQSEHDHSSHSTPQQNHIHHMHQAGSWMFEYRYMNMAMEDLLAGTSDVPVSQAIGMMSQYRNSAGLPYMMAPTKMTMNMHMLMGMYSVNEKLSVMVMGNYIASDMDMVMATGATMAMDIAGIGDTEVTAMFKMDSLSSDEFIVNLGLRLPTGDIDEPLSMTMTMPNGMVTQSNPLAPYGMRLGHDAFELKPGITFKRRELGGITWGFQGTLTLPVDDSSKGYNHGNRIDLLAFAQKPYRSFVFHGNLALSNAEEIQGEDQRGLNKQSIPNDPVNYGGKRVDLGAGVKYSIGYGFDVGVSLDLPIYQNLNGLQMKTNTVLSLSLQYMLM